MAEMEKLTINLSPVDLGQIELLVEHGFYANRAEFIRVAIHDQLAGHTDTVQQVTKRDEIVIGALVYARETLEERRRTGKRMAIRVLGFLSIAEDVPPALAREVIASVKVLGVFRASAAVKEALADRIVR
jgi:Arc/MetJ-type ribon-helix-helix transcriptional regulator